MLITSLLPEIVDLDPDDLLLPSRAIPTPALFNYRQRGRQVPPLGCAVMRRDLPDV